MLSFLTIGLHVTNSTTDRNGNGGNTMTSNKQSSGLQEDKLGEVASVPKCLGSALCPD